MMTTPETQRQAYMRGYEAGKADRDETQQLCNKLAALLDQIAIAVNGPEPPLTKWSFHDLADKVDALKAEHSALVELVAVDDLGDKLAAEKLYPGKFFCDEATRYEAELDYRKRRPEAWRAARAAIAASAPDKEGT